MAVLLALITSATWGTSDFFGGLATRREPVARVMLWAHGLGLIAIAAIAPFVADAFESRDLALGAIAGVIGLVGLLLLYQGLSQGPMAVVAPLSALTAALVPVLWGLRSGDPLSTLTLVGLLLGLGAVVAISSESDKAVPDHDSGAERRTASLSPSVVATAIIAGTCFGSIVLIYDATSEDGAPWPIVSGRFASTALLVLFALSRRKPLTPGSALGLAAVAGLGDTLANMTLLFATSAAVGSSELSVVAVVAAFYPAATVLWARVVLQERLGRVRLAGLALGLFAIALMTLG